MPTATTRPPLYGRLILGGKPHARVEVLDNCGLAMEIRVIERIYLPAQRRWIEANSSHIVPSCAVEIEARTEA